MEKEENQIQASQHLTNFLNMVKKESQRPLRLAIVEKMPIPGMYACLQKHPTHIFITIKEGDSINSPHVETAIAHEATHGWLFYAKQFKWISFENEELKKEGAYLSILFNAIDDLVVEKILQENNFLFLQDNYIRQLKKEIKIIRKHKDIYMEFSDRPLFKEFFLIARYLLAWGTCRYLKIDPTIRKLAKKFMKIVKRTFSEAYTKIATIVGLFETNDIFISEGNNIVKERILELWDDKKIALLDLY